MAKKPTKQDYKKRWETRRRNAALKAKQEAKQEVRLWAAHAVQAPASANSGMANQANGVVRTRALDAPATQGAVLGGAAAPPTPYDPIGARVDFETRTIMETARKKDGHNKIKQRLYLLRADAAHDVQKQMHEEHSDRIKEINNIHAIDTVSSFMAIVEAAGRLNGGPLPPAMVIGGRVVAKVYDALREAGYTANGFQTQRENIMNRDCVLRR